MSASNGSVAGNGHRTRRWGLRELVSDEGAHLYLDGPDDGIGGAGAFFLLLDEPEVYGLPPDPVVTTAHLPEMWKTAAIATGALVLGVVASFLGGPR